jgi:hypothetical protein
MLPAMRHRWSLFALCAVAVPAAILGNGCSASSATSGTFTGGGSPTGTTGTGGSAGHGGSTATSTSSTSTSGLGGNFTGSGGNGGNGGMGGMIINPCGTACGPKELCDDDHLGLDDNCDGQVDEGCQCSAGEAHFCFKGDPSYHGADGCFDGSEKCTEMGIWGPCLGGVHADPDKCFLNSKDQCHPITSPPFADVNLKDGTGMFSQNAVAGSEVWTVTCPMGVNPCPMVGGMNPADDFKPLQSGEYKIHYTKQIPGGMMESCDYSLFVGAPGLRVELSWEHDLGGEGVDLDLHMHQPMNTMPWATSFSGAQQECTWSNCVESDFEFPGPDQPHWFFDPPNMPPDPVNWFLDPIMEKNTCYYAPRGVGANWQMLGKGCHNPRLDLDNITCDPTVLDPNSASFCAPENVNIDYPPLDQWMRIGVHYYYNHGLGYDVHPEVKIFCDGALAADLGPGGYYVPQNPVTFGSSDGDGSGNNNRFWVVADVAFKKDMCTKGCVVKPVYSDTVQKTPYFTIDSVATTTFAPAYPPAP